MTRDSRGGRSVACPDRRCRAAVGEDCHEMRGADHYVLSGVHRARAAKARQRVERQERKGRLSAEETEAVRWYRDILCERHVVYGTAAHNRGHAIADRAARAAIDRLLKERGHR